MGFFHDTVSQEELYRRAAAQQGLFNQGLAGQLGGALQGFAGGGIQARRQEEYIPPPSPPSERVAFKRTYDNIREELQDEVNDWLKDIN